MKLEELNCSCSSLYHSVIALKLLTVERISFMCWTNHTVYSKAHKES